jgi:polyphosphate glucokinase
MIPTNSSDPVPAANEPTGAVLPPQVLVIDTGGSAGASASVTPSDQTPDAPPAAPPGGPSEEIREEPAEKTPTQTPTRERSAAPTSILAIDIGGTKIKILATGQTEPRKAPSGKEFTPARLVETVRSLAHDWDYEAISIGLPALVGPQGPRSEPGNLGPGWVGFDFAAAFGKPVKMVNDAAMQALGSYEGGRMLFLGLGTGLGSTLITGHVIVPLELGRLLYDGRRTLGEVLGRRGLDRLGKGEWRKAVHKVVTTLMHAFVVDYVVIGGGNAKHIKEPPPGARRGHNLTAFRGGFRLWSVEDVWVLAASGGDSPQPSTQEALRLL